MKKHQEKLEVLSQFVKVKTINPKITHRLLAKDLGLFDSTTERHENDLNINSPYQLQQGRPTIISVKKLILSSKYQQSTSSNGLLRLNKSTEKKTKIETKHL